MDDLKVFIARREATCAECGEALGRHAWITLVEGKGPVCLACADLDHLLFLPAGDACITRQARRLSTLSAVVLEWNRTRSRYERQGLLVDAGALDQAELDCLAEAEARERQRQRAALLREEMDQPYVDEFARCARRLYPAMPAGREREVAEHACRKYSDRGGCTTTRAPDEDSVRLAVIAHIRHKDTAYDSLLAEGVDRWDAREKVKEDVYAILDRWGENAA